MEGMPLPASITRNVRVELDTAGDRKDTALRSSQSWRWFKGIARILFLEAGRAFNSLHNPRDIILGVRQLSLSGSASIDFAVE